MRTQWHGSGPPCSFLWLIGLSLPLAMENFHTCLRSSQLLRLISRGASYVPSRLIKSVTMTCVNLSSTDRTGCPVGVPLDTVLIIKTILKAS